MSSLHFYRWNQFKVIPLASTVLRTVRTRDVGPTSKFFGDV